MVKKELVKFRLINDEAVYSDSYVSLVSVVCEGELQMSNVKAFIMDVLPFGVEMILGYDVITKHKMLGINPNIMLRLVSTEKSCGVIKETSTEQKRKSIVIDEIDFFEEWNGALWKVKWKWNQDRGGEK